VTDTVRVARISSTDDASSPSWTVALFAHNEARRIRSALESVVAASDGSPITIVVLANGCRDDTARVVRDCGSFVPNLTLVEIALADKANAWNVFVHTVLPAVSDASLETCFFMDGDVTLEPHALPLLASAFDEMPSLQAAGGMPATGRDREDWSRRMVVTGMLAGNFYALRASFVEEIRRRALRLPVGLIGEDFLVSWLVGHQLGSEGPRDSGPQCGFHPHAKFRFRSLSWTRVGDYRLYARRKWRYAWRGVQHNMLTSLLIERGVGAMPRDVDELYRVGPLPSRMVWIGRDTPLRLLALLAIRRRRRRGNRIG
jgi:glycosyltransferase involved in cell wall biosynthesis